MSESEKSVTSGLLAVAGIVVAFCIAGVLGAVAHKSAPFPIPGLLILLFFLFKRLVGIPIALLVLALLHFGWTRPATNGRSRFTYRTWLGLSGLGVASVIWYQQSWSIGMKSQGETYMVGCAAIAAFVFLLVITLGLVSSLCRQPTVALAARWLALAWVCTYGYPWLG